MQIMEGVLSKKNSIDWNGTPLHSFQVEGSRRWYKTGQKEIPFPEGTKVRFEERNGQVESSTVTLANDTSTSTPEVVAVSNAGGSIPPVNITALSRDAYWANREARDIAAEAARRYAAARADATRVVVAALQTDSLPYAANTTKAKKWDLLRGYVREITQEFLDDEK